MDHLRGLWGRFWPLVLLSPLTLMGFILSGSARSEHYIIILVIFALSLGNTLTRDLLIAAAPGVAIALGYETLGFLRPLYTTPDRVWACEFHTFDAALFGFGSGHAPADFFAQHHSTGLDLALAFPYTLFWGAVIVWAIVLFVVSRGRLRRYMWTLALVHLLAFVLWIALPTAPPWYVRAFGCGIDIDAAPQAGALARLDALFGITYYDAFYSRAPTVFGAFPSLHVSFPAAAMISGWRWFGRTGKVVSLILTLWMLLASVYLDHHWLVDGLVTIVLTLLVHALLVWIWPAYTRPDASARWPEGSH